MTQQEKSSRIAVLLFTDIVDSVGMERRIGTDAYSRLLKQHHEIFFSVLAGVGDGRVRYDTGDGTLSEFTTPGAAVNAALLFQKNLREARWEGESPKVRVGIHQGQLAEIKLDTTSDGKIVGLPVSIASRVMSLAQGGQILMTRAVYDDAKQFVKLHPTGGKDGPPPPLKWKSHGKYLFKGSDEAMEVFEVGAAGFAPLTAPPYTDKATSPTALPAPRAIRHRPLIGALLAVICGLALWQMPVAEGWINASYDYLFRFGARDVTNQVLVVEMDESSYTNRKQQRGAWDRKLHAQLLDKLTEGGCPLVVFDIFFGQELDVNGDDTLAAAIKRHGHVVLMSKVVAPEQPGSKIAETLLPHQRFLSATTNVGIGKLDAETGETVRRHWPFPAPAEIFHSLPWTAARLSGGKLPEEPTRQWLRYYRSEGGHESLSFHLALLKPPEFFQGKVVFIGNKPMRQDPSSIEDDKYRTPYTRWTSDAVGGVKCLVTEYLNLMNGDWLRRFPAWLELVLLGLVGGTVGWGLPRMRPLLALAVSVGLILCFTLGAVSWSYFTNYWFPWLIVVGGQIPCALVWSLASRGRLVPAQTIEIPKTVVLPETKPAKTSDHPETDDYEFFGSPFGEGAFGKVWVVRNSVGQFQALKAVYKSKFGKEEKPYEMEFKGIKRFKPISGEHPGLLRVDFVSRQKEEGYFYYVMELGDATGSGWEQNPASYRPCDLFTAAQLYPHGRLPIPDCVNVGLAIADALEFLHRAGFVHRDIKPTNIIFVKGRPKLADVGLVTDIRPADQVTSIAGTEHYLPPAPEPPGTIQADIYALGKVLYVISTGNHPRQFPELPPGLLDGTEQGEQFLLLNKVMVKACDPDCVRRYAAAEELRAGLMQVQNSLKAGS